MNDPMTQDDPNGRDPTVFAGTAISPGVGIGPAWLVVDLLKSAPDPAAIARDQIASEWNRVLASFEQTRRELEDSALRIEEQFDAALAGIFRAHGMMLAGIVSSGEIERELESLVGAEVAVRRVFRRLHERFLALKGPTLRQRCCGWRPKAVAGSRRWCAAQGRHDELAAGPVRRQDRCGHGWHLRYRSRDSGALLFPPEQHAASRGQSRERQRALMAHPLADARGSEIIAPAIQIHISLNSHAT